MSSLVTSVLNVTFALLRNKFRHHTAGKLKGDTTDEKCRQLIIRELDEIKTKLDGLACKDLLSSISFLKEGVCHLKQFLDNATNDEAPFADQKEDASQTDGLRMMEASDSNCGRNAVFNDAFPLIACSFACN